MTGMLASARRIESASAVFEAVGEDPYTRMMTSGEVSGCAAEGAAAWFTELPWRSVLCVRGEPDAAARLLVELRRAGLAPAGTHVQTPHLDRDAFDALPARTIEKWLLLATRRSPRRQAHEESVEQLPTTAYEEVPRLLALGGLNGELDPRAPWMRRWFGIREQGRLIACGADRSRNGVGFLAKIAVDPEHRGRGLGAALTAAMTRALHAEFGTVALGVTTENTSALGLYERLGYRRTAEVLSCEITDSAEPGLVPGGRAD